MKINYGKELLEPKLMFWWRKSNFVAQPILIYYFSLSFNKYFPLSLVLICVSVIFLFAEIINTINEIKKGIIEFGNPNVKSSEGK